MTNKNKIFLSTIGILTILLITIGLSYAYFSANLTGGEEATTITVTGGTMNIIYNGGANINVANIIPSDNAISTKTFTVTGNNTTDIEMKYQINLVVESNTFSEEALKYKLVSTNTDNNGTVVPSINELTNIGAGPKTIELGVGEFLSPTSGNKVHTYSLEIYFPNQDYNQNIDQEKEIKSHVEVEIYDAPSTFSDYLISLAGTNQGTGKLEKEYRNVYGQTQIKNNTYYTNIINDEDFPYTWDNTNKTWTSTNNLDWCVSSISFKPSTNGQVAICYTLLSEIGYGEATISVDGAVVKEEIMGQKTNCLDLGNLTTANTIKVTYDNYYVTEEEDNNIIFSITEGEYTEQEIGYYFQGENPNNYVSFNNESWRVIGVFNEETHGLAGQNLIKIIREDFLYEYAWDISDNNNWCASSLQYHLNNVYYDEINDKDLIESIEWKSSGHDTPYATAKEFYVSERGLTESYGPKICEGKIGLMYASDYGFVVPSSVCERTTYLRDYGSEECQNNNWLKKEESDEWTLTPHSYHYFAVFNYFSGTLVYSGVNKEYLIRPSLYLKYSTPILGGEGTKENPYKIIMR